MAKTTHTSDVEGWLENIDIAELNVRDGKHLRGVGRALDALEAAEIDLHRAIEDARAAGESWSAIGMVLGTSKQAAHRKFGR